MTKRSYMEAVMEGLKAVSTVDVAFAPHNVDAGSLRESLPINDACDGKRKKIYVRLLLSIDRRESTAAAMETVCTNIGLSRIFFKGHMFDRRSV